MILALVCAPGPLDLELRDSVLYRRNVERRWARNAAQARAQAAADKPDIVVVDSMLPEAARLVAELRDDPLTRKVSIVALARGDFDPLELELIEAGANAILRLPPGPEWDDRLFRLVHVPVRKETRLPIHLQMSAGFAAAGAPIPALVLNLSVHGMLLLCPGPLQVGDDLVFAFRLPDRPGIIQGSATIVRQMGEHQYGIELTHVDGEGRRLIREFAESNAP